jgi:hypothetical protein
MKFNLDDYEPVEARIRRFYADHPDGRITTELLSSADEIKIVVCKAFLHVGEQLVATGLAFEREGEGMVNNTSHLENCETSAIGRALANYNYSGNKRPSREEMGKVARKEPSIDDAKAKTLALLEAPELAGDLAEMLREEVARAGTIEEVRKVYTRAQGKIKEATVVY